MKYYIQRIDRGNDFLLLCIGILNKRHLVIDEGSLVRKPHVTKNFYVNMRQATQGVA